MSAGNRSDPGCGFSAYKPSKDGNRLHRSGHSQSGIVFRIPAIVGMSAMYFLYAMIMFANDGKLVPGEIAGLGICLGILLLISVIYYIIYRYTVRKMCAELNI